jgi:hypothetical protein
MLNEFCCCSNNYTDYTDGVWKDINSECLREFLMFTKGETLSNASTPYAIQTRVIYGITSLSDNRWYIREGNGFRVDRTNNSAMQFLSSNDIKGFKCLKHGRHVQLQLYTLAYHNEYTNSGRYYYFHHYDILSDTYYFQDDTYSDQCDYRDDIFECETDAYTCYAHWKEAKQLEEKKKKERKNCCCSFIKDLLSTCIVIIIAWFYFVLIITTMQDRTRVTIHDEV